MHGQAGLRFRRDLAEDGVGSSVGRARAEELPSAAQLFVDLFDLAPVEDQVRVDVG
jgi:hypothetical protein